MNIRMNLAQGIYEKGFVERMGKDETLNPIVDYLLENHLLDQYFEEDE